MPQLFDITKWNPQPWYNTGGTRSKKYVQEPSTGKYFYFKKSYKTEGRDYFFEFWSEVIATEIGVALGFDVLKYDVAIDGEEMGCLSESMINDVGETLTEGGKYLQALELQFDPNVKEGRKLYSFQLIEEALKVYKLDHMHCIIEIIIFDSIIGNGDRHQENWAFISKLTLAGIGVSEIEKAMKNKYVDKLPKWIQWIIRQIKHPEKDEFMPDIKADMLKLQKPKSFAPIFDNGSSLGRELTDEKVNNLLNDNNQLLAYIRRGVSEIHWEKEKLNHLELVKNLIKTSYEEIITNTIKRVVNSFNIERAREIIFNVDASIPEELHKFKLPNNRKELMLKLITLRIEQLKLLVN